MIPFWGRRKGRLPGVWLSGVSFLMNPGICCSSNSQGGLEIRIVLISAMILERYNSVFDTNERTSHLARGF